MHGTNVKNNSVWYIIAKYISNYKVWIFFIFSFSKEKTTLRNRSFLLFVRKGAVAPTHFVTTAVVLTARTVPFMHRR